MGSHEEYPSREREREKGKPIDLANRENTSTHVRASVAISERDERDLLFVHQHQ